MSQATMSSMGSTNTHWGVCGFTSTFYSMYETRPGTRGMLIGAGIATRVLAEIKTYLVMLKAEGEKTLLDDIQSFCQTFAGFEAWTIDDYIARVNKAVNMSEADIKKEKMYSIGMPPHAVADYLKRVWAQASDVLVLPQGGDSGGDGIIGVKRTDLGMKAHDGLCHWMYRTNGVIHSWGRAFKSVAEANPKYVSVRLIRFR